MGRGVYPNRPCTHRAIRKSKRAAKERFHDSTPGRRGECFRDARYGTVGSVSWIIRLFVLALPCENIYKHGFNIIINYEYCDGPRHAMTDSSLSSIDRNWCNRTMVLIAIIFSDYSINLTIPIDRDRDRPAADGCTFRTCSMGFQRFDGLCACIEHKHVFAYTGLHWSEQVGTRGGGASWPGKLRFKSSRAFR